MIAHGHVDAGICGFHTDIRAQSDDQQYVAFSVRSECEKVTALAARLDEMDPIDAYQELMPGSESTFQTLAQETLPSCCVGCVVPLALFKAMQVAAGLALPKDIRIALERE